MTYREISTGFLKHYGMVSTSDVRQIDIMVPFLMMDIAYQSYLRNILTLDVKHRMASCRNAWSQAYKSFNMRLFNAFPDEESEEITDMMDDYDEYMHNDIVVLEVSISKCLCAPDSKDDAVLVSCMMSHIIARMSSIMWSVIYKNVSVFREMAKDLDRISRKAYEFMNMYFKPDRNISVSDSSDVKKSIDIIYRKTLKWSKEKDKQTKN